MVTKPLATRFRVTRRQYLAHASARVLWSALCTEDFTVAFSAYTHDDAGDEIVPQTKDDWSQRVSASRTRNWCNGATLNDWMERYGEANGFERDPDPDPRVDWKALLFSMGNAFESAVVDHLETLVPVYRLSGGWERSQSFESCHETFEAMCRGESLIHQAVLRNPANRTYG